MIPLTKSTLEWMF